MGDKVDRIRYLYVQKIISLALSEMEEIWTSDDKYEIEKFLRITKQYGKRGNITDDEIRFILRTPIDQVFIELQ